MVLVLYSALLWMVLALAVTKPFYGQGMQWLKLSPECTCLLVSTDLYDNHGSKVCPNILKLRNLKKKHLWKKKHSEECVFSVHSQGSVTLRGLSAVRTEFCWWDGEARHFLRRVHYHCPHGYNRAQNFSEQARGTIELLSWGCKQCWVLVAYSISCY